MYTHRDFNTKKELKEAVANQTPDNPVTVFDTAIIGAIPTERINGRVYLEGPHYPKPHKWYAQATVENGVVKKVS